MITTCGSCGKAYEAGSEEQANEPNRLCTECYQAAKVVLLDQFRQQLLDHIKVFSVGQMRVMLASLRRNPRLGENPEIDVLVPFAMIAMIDEIIRRLPIGGAA